MAKTKVNCHLCGTEIERQLCAGIENYSCGDCKLKRSRDWSKILTERYRQKKHGTNSTNRTPADNNSPTS